VDRGTNQKPVTQLSCFKAAQWSAAFIHSFLLLTPRNLTAPFLPSFDAGQRKVSLMDCDIVDLAEDDTLMDALMIVQLFRRSKSDELGLYHSAACSRGCGRTLPSLPRLSAYSIKPGCTRLFRQCFCFVLHGCGPDFNLAQSILLRSLTAFER